MAQPIQPALPEEAAVSSPDEALDRLMVGNQRYVNNRSLPLNESASRRSEVAKGQSPFATIFSCVDSRVPPELVFDRGLGDLFVIRTAGHTLDQAVLGSLEFGVEELKIPLLLVMGHSRCAVKATAEALEAHAHAHGSIEYLVEAITPAVEQAAGEAGDSLTNSCYACHREIWSSSACCNRQVRNMSYQLHQRQHQIDSRQTDGVADFERSRG